MRFTVAMIAAYLSGCAGFDATCGELEEDRENGRCVCPAGSTPSEDGWSCFLPDGGVLRNPNAPDASSADAGETDAASDAPVGDACVECTCSEGEARDCPASGAGACALGRQRCEGGEWTECVAQASPEPETCNGVDDDCNGTPDDGSAAGSCVATARVLAAGCSGGGCFVDRCADGYLDCDRDFANGCEQALGSPSACLACGDVCGWACGGEGCNDAERAEVGSGFSVALREDRTLVAWGLNGSGQLGDGTVGDRLRPVEVELADVEDLSLSATHACALAGGDVWCWGSGMFGQLVPGSQDDSRVPLRTYTGAQAVAAGVGYTCVLRRDEDAWCWGGIMFRGEPLHRVPRQVGTRGVQITSGLAHACVRSSFGGVSCWGTNNQGVLGAGYDYAESGPTAVVGLDDAIHVSAGDYHNCAVREGGTVVCWGLGAGVQSASLVTVEGLDEVETLDCGGYNACAIRSDRSLWCWGSNGRGEVGDGTTERRTRPVRVLEDVASVAVGQTHTCAVLVDGGVRCWGANTNGGLGTGTREPSLTPVAALPPQ